MPDCIKRCGRIELCTRSRNKGQFWAVSPGAAGSHGRLIPPTANTSCPSLEFQVWYAKDNIYCTVYLVYLPNVPRYEVYFTEELGYFFRDRRTERLKKVPDTHNHARLLASCAHTSLQNDKGFHVIQYRQSPRYPSRHRTGSTECQRNFQTLDEAISSLLWDAKPALEG